MKGKDKGWDFQTLVKPTPIAVGMGFQGYG